MAVRESIGSIPCLCCGQLVPAKKSSGGSVSVSCPWCDLSAYAKEGTQAHRRIMAALPKPVADPAPAPAPVETPAPAKATPKTIFG